MFDLLEKVYFITLFSKLDIGNQDSNTYNVGSYENVGCFLNLRTAENTLEEMGQDFYSRRNYEYAMISSYNIAEIYPRIVDLQVYEAIEYEVEVPLVDHVTHEVYYENEEKHGYEPIELDDETLLMLKWLRLPFKSVIEA